MTGRRKPLSKRSAAKNQHKKSSACRHLEHGFCSGSVFVRFDRTGRPLFGRCQCNCHSGG